MGSKNTTVFITFFLISFLALSTMVKADSDNGDDGEPPHQFKHKSPPPPPKLKSPPPPPNCKFPPPPPPTSPPPTLTPPPPPPPLATPPPPPPTLTPPPPPPAISAPSPAPVSEDVCPINLNEFSVCGNFFLNNGTGTGDTQPCCSLFDGLSDNQKVNCLCDAYIAKVFLIPGVDPNAVDYYIIVNGCSALNFPSSFCGAP